MRMCLVYTMAYCKSHSPIPPTPFPGGEGGEYYFFRKGPAAPCIPAITPDASCADRM